MPGEPADHMLERGLVNLMNLAQSIDEQPRDILRFVIATSRKRIAAASDAQTLRQQDRDEKDGLGFGGDKRLNLDEIVLHLTIDIGGCVTAVLKNAAGRSARKHEGDRKLQPLTIGKPNIASKLDLLHQVCCLLNVRSGNARGNRGQQVV